MKDAFANVKSTTLSNSVQEMRELALSLRTKTNGLAVRALVAILDADLEDEDVRRQLAPKVHGLVDKILGIYRGERLIAKAREILL